MPFKSKSQQRFMFAAEERGDVPKGTAREWAHKTPNIKKLPEKVKHKKTAADIAIEALDRVTARITKTASIAPAALSARMIAKKLKKPSKKTAAEIADMVLLSKTASLPGWDECKARSKKKMASNLANAVLATDGRASSVMHDLFNGGKWAPGGVEYQGPMKIAAELPTNVADRAPAAIGSIIGAPKMKPPKLPPTPKPPKPPKAKKTAAEIAALVMRKTAALGR